MIDKATRLKVQKIVEEFWSKKAEVDGDFKRLLSGTGEVGHSIAAFVQADTIEELSEKGVEIGIQTNKASGKPLKRSFGDFWIRSNGIYNPVNIKAGEFDKNGQPNLVSLSRLLSFLLHEQVDCYYVLIIKISQVSVKDKMRFIPHVYFVDMLDYLDYVSYNAGPGQLMIKEKEFYKALESGKTTKHLSVDERVLKLASIFQEGLDRLILDRRKKMTKKLGQASGFKSSGLDQSKLHFHVNP